MGVAAVAVPFAGAAIVAMTRDDDDDVVVDRHLSTINIGGQLKNVKTTSQYRDNQVVTVGNLDQFLQSRQVPADKIQAAQKLKYAKIGTIQSLQFQITDTQYQGRVIVIKGKKIDPNNIQLLLYCDIIEAQFVPPQIQVTMSRSGVSHSNRGLDQNQSNVLTNAIKQKALELEGQWKAIQI